MAFSSWDALFNDKLREVGRFGLTLLTRHGRRPQGQSHFIHRKTETGHQCRAKGDMTSMCHIKHDTQSRLDTSHMVGCELTYLIGQLAAVHIQLADKMG